jgi:hypothetical protein
MGTLIFISMMRENISMGLAGILAIIAQMSIFMARKVTRNSISAMIISMAQVKSCLGWIKYYAANVC